MIHRSYRSGQAQIIVALDEPTWADAELIVNQLGSRADFYKVGLQLFTSAGPAAVEKVKSSGAKVFLDLKLHDIPNTVASAVKSAVALGVDLCTIHLSGGPEMCAAAVEAAGDRLTVLGVTVLTSSNEATLRAVGIETPVAKQVSRLARMGFDAGLRGFVASPLEVAMLREVLREELGSDPVLVIPGVRPAGADVGDQKRIATPADVVRAGATHLVIGRPITRAENPAAAYDKILAEIASA